jgi:hypothetical protein
MGYMIVFGPCIGCGNMFAFNPHRVPSCSAITGHREPICRGCVERVNPLRIRNGLPPIVPADDAYEPAEE